MRLTITRSCARTFSRIVQSIVMFLHTASTNSRAIFDSRIWLLFENWVQGHGAMSGATSVLLLRTPYEKSGLERNPDSLCLPTLPIGHLLVRVRALAARPSARSGGHAA